MPEPIDVVVTVHNRADMALRTLRSLESNTSYPFRPIVVDDGSTDGHTSGRLDAWVRAYNREKRPNGKAVLIRHETAQRYTKAVNAGIEATNTKRHVVLLNSDTYVTPGWLRHMVAALESDGRIGMVNPASTDKGYAHIPMPHGANVLSVADALADVAPVVEPGMPMPHGFCLLIRRAMLDEMGLFDAEKWPHGYGEETDYYAKGLSHGWTAALAPRAYVWHRTGASYGIATRNKLGGAALKRVMDEHGAALNPIGRAWRQRNPTESLRQKLEGALKDRPCERPRITFLVGIYGRVGGVRAIHCLADAMIERGWDVSEVYLGAMRTEDRDDFADHLFSPKAYPNAQKANMELGDWVKRGVLVAALDGAEAFVEAAAKDHPGITPMQFLQDDQVRFSDDKIETYRNGRTSKDAALLAKAKAARERTLENLARPLPSVAVSRFAADARKRYAGFPSVSVVGIGIPVDRFIPGPKEATPLTVVGFLRKEKRRNPDLLREVFQRLHEKYRKYARLVAIGDPHGRQIPGVEHVKSATPDDVAHILSLADILVEPSVYQGFGLPALEAMAAGAAVVSTDNHGIDEYGVHEENCLIVPQGDGEADRIVDAVARCVQDRELRESLGAAGRKTAESWDWSSIAVKWEHAIKEISERAEIAPASDAEPTWSGEAVPWVASVRRLHARGDIIMAEPVVGELRRRGYAVDFHAMPMHRDIVEAMGATWKAPSAPMRGEVSCDLEGATESSNSHADNGVDAMADKAGIEITRRTPRLSIPKWGGKFNGKNPVAVNLFSAGTLMRSVTEPMATQILTQLIRAGMTPILLGHRAPKSVPGGCVNMVGKTGSLLEAAAIARECRGLLCTDSGLMHAAGAIGVPAVALFGPMPSSSRATYYPSVLGLDVAVGCAPCYAHDHECCNEKKDFACSVVDAETVADACRTVFLGGVPRVNRLPLGRGRLTTVAIPNYNTGKFLDRCLETLLPTLVYDSRIREVVVVDNGSTDGSQRMLAAKYARVPKFRVIENGKNLYIYRAWNQVVEGCLDDILILGSDTEKVDNNWFAAMRYWMDRNPSAGLVAGQQIRPERSGRRRIIFGGIIDDRAEGQHPHISGWEDMGDCAEPTKHTWLTHSNVLVRREVFDAVGLYDDEQFSIYCGDEEFGKRATDAGFEAWYCPYSRVLHWEGRGVDQARRSGYSNAAIIREHEAIGRRAML